MNIQTLTPHLRRRVMALDLYDRIALKAEIEASLRDVSKFSTLHRLEYLAATLQGLTGIDIREKTKEAKHTIARRVFIKVAREEGHTLKVIGRFLHLDHSTIHCSLRYMDNIFIFPTAYQDYIALYNTTLLLLFGAMSGLNQGMTASPSIQHTRTTHFSARSKLPRSRATRMTAIGGKCMAWESSVH